MKRLFIVLVTILVMSAPSIVEAQKFMLGVQAGLNFSDIQIAEKDAPEGAEFNYSPVMLFGANAYMGYRSASVWGLSFEPGYIIKGGQKHYDKLQVGDMLFASQNMKYTSAYIQLPVTIDAYITDRFSVSLGPEVNIFLSSKAESQDVSYDTSYGNEKYELCGIISTAYSITDNIDVRLLYNHSITKSSEVTWVDGTGVVTGSSRQYFQYLQLTLRLKTSW